MKRRMAEPAAAGNRPVVGGSFGEAHRDAGHVLAPQQRDRLAEPPAMQVHETGTVRVLFLRHPVERTRGRRVFSTQALRVPPVNARIVFLR